ncbi:hypothetical protein LCGC14_0894330 [marine sediment metagenome]|uniref:Uncharacterized protein n=1 Tax=marine sediment metagenome TaxID=412755 RepID=A0A0F9S588_9ZZZZ
MTIKEQQRAIWNGLGELKLSLHSCDGKTQQHKRLGPDDKSIILALLTEKGAVLSTPGKSNANGWLCNDCTAKGFTATASLMEKDNGV